MEPRISGTYVTNRGGITYAYDGFWTEIAKTVRWDAKVRRDGELVATPQGVIEDVPRNTDIDALVRTNIETAIENKISVSA
jgi:hypothetical protein